MNILNYYITHTKFIIFSIYITKKSSFAKKSITQITNKLTKYNIYETKIKITIYIINTIIYLIIENMEKHLLQQRVNNYIINPGKNRRYKRNCSKPIKIFNNNIYTEQANNRYFDISKSKRRSEKILIV